MRRFIYLLVLFVSFSFVFQNKCFAQAKEEKRERVAEMQMLRKPVSSYLLTSDAALFFGYDSNVELTPAREKAGSAFQEFLYSLNFEKPLAAGCRFNFNYDIDDINYSSSTGSSNLLNHLRFNLDKKLNRLFNTGAGYDFSYFYYPNNADGDYMFHKGFVYLKNRIGAKAFHQLTFEYGYKKHTSREALSDTLTVLQDKELVERRQSVAYTIGSNILPRLSLQLTTRFYINDSNALYLDFYDYKSYEASPSVIYKLSEAINLVMSFTYLRKNYNSRTLSTDSTEKEKDNVYYSNVGATFKINKDNSATLFYTYRDNATNEPLEKYTENIITLGWQHHF